MTTGGTGVVALTVTVNITSAAMFITSSPSISLLFSSDAVTVIVAVPAATAVIVIIPSAAVTAAVAGMFETALYVSASPSGSMK